MSKEELLKEVKELKDCLALYIANANCTGLITHLVVGIFHGYDKAKEIIKTYEDREV